MAEEFIGHGWAFPLRTDTTIGLAASRFLSSDKAKTVAATTTSTTEPPGVVALKGVKLIDTETESGSYVGALVIDGNLDTYCSRNANGDSTPHLTFDFGRTVKLTRVEIASGAAGDEFAKRPPPQELARGLRRRLPAHLHAQGPAGGADDQLRSARDQAVPGGVVQSTYPGSDPAPNGQRTSIRELRFFAQAQDQG